MGGGENDDVLFQQRNESAVNCPSSGMNTNPLSLKVSGMPLNSVSLYKSLTGADHFFGSGWDPILSLNQVENFGVSSTISHNDFTPSYTIPLENQGMSNTSNLDQYSSDLGFVELMPKIPCLGSGNFSKMVSSFGLPENAQFARSGCANYVPNKEGCNERTSMNVSQSYEDRQISEEAKVVSTNGMTRKRAPERNSLLNLEKSAELECQGDLSGDSSRTLKEQDEKRQKIEHNNGAKMPGKQAAKPAKDVSQSGEAPKDYVHMRAKRGQATNSHSLAERVRREKISERMRLLQELVPGCNKITGKAVMLDEIINYVQSLQQQVEFLSMKLATVNPELNIDIERILSKDILHSSSGGATIIGYTCGMNSRSYPPGIFQGTMPSIPGANPQFCPMPQSAFDPEFQSIFQMGYDETAAVDSLGPNGRLKPEL